ncbi:hypothetical protein [Ideonella sp. A 288]|uniref:hypothetical protein n=1 Tax=Ideonella sp. A 288 TaxID=1962181 RepID=UPI000B4BDF1B|nr:hypothetical protein [Ideonella sp. A 288]
MSSVTKTLCLLAAGLGLAAAAQAGPAWQQLGGQGDRYFVLVDPAMAQDAATYRHAAASLCKPGRTCIVMYWHDRNAAASKMPLSAVQAAGLQAQYTRTPATGGERLLFRCRSGSQPGACLQ